MAVSMLSAYLAAAGAAVLWGASFLLTKIVLTQLGPMATAALRWGVAALALIVIVSATARRREMARRALRHDGWSFVGLGLVGVSLFYILQNMALVYTTSIDVGLIMNGFPILAAVLGVWLFHEKLTRRGLGGVTVALVGVTLVTLGGLVEAVPLPGEPGRRDAEPGRHPVRQGHGGRVHHRPDRPPQE